MFVKIKETLLTAGLKIKKTIGNQDVSAFGAFACGDVVRMELEIPRALGITGVALRLAPDGGIDRDLPLSFSSSFLGIDLYSTVIDTEDLCGKNEEGLFYYSVVFKRGNETLFSDTANNFDFTVSDREGGRFRLLVTRKNYDTPAWFRGGILYHIFVDRFARGSQPVPCRADAEINPDWEHGIPQYAPYPGAPLKNNVFFGGTLWGVAEHLDRLEELGVTVLYLSPIFRAYSNHKYDTGDYMTVDEMFGGEEAFRHLLGEAHRRGMRVILDGVFNHTGDDSRYFNRYGKYASLGAFQSPESPYYPWYRFRKWPDEYESWWGISIMPRLNYGCPACLDYFTGSDGVCCHYISTGIDGWRLDVADELPDVFLDRLRENVKAKNPEAILIGEVWENAADKIAYGNRRRYLSGRQLDSVMNYPIRSGILAFAQYSDAVTLTNALTTLYASYPRCVSDCLMNLLGSHDTERILTVLGAPEDSFNRTNEELSVSTLTDEQRARAVHLLKIASLLQYTVFGVPSVYYGDEAGVEGYHDPFCRRPYPWGRENKEILNHYRALGRIRRENPAFDGGDFEMVLREDHALAYRRAKGKNRVLIAANRGSQPLSLPLAKTAEVLLQVGGTRAQTGKDGLIPDRIVLEADSAVILREIR